jgi:hypothetical protein
MQRGIYSYPGTNRIVYGTPFDQALRRERELTGEEAMHDRWIHTNPRKIDGPATVRQLLDAAW